MLIWNHGCLCKPCENLFHLDTNWILAYIQHLKMKKKSIFVPEFIIFGSWNFNELKKNAAVYATCTSCMQCVKYILWIPTSFLLKVKCIFQLHFKLCNNWMEFPKIHSELPTTLSGISVRMIIIDEKNVQNLPYSCFDRIMNLLWLMVIIIYYFEFVSIRNIR